MSVETISEIWIRLGARKNRVKLVPLPTDSSPTRLDVEESFLEDYIAKPAEANKTQQKPIFESEPE